MKISEIKKTLEYIEETYGNLDVVLCYGRNTDETCEQDTNIFLNTVGMKGNRFELHIQNFPY